MLIAIPDMLGQHMQAARYLVSMVAVVKLFL